MSESTREGPAQANRDGTPSQPLHPTDSPVQALVKRENTDRHLGGLTVWLLPPTPAPLSLHRAQTSAVWGKNTQRTIHFPFYTQICRERPVVTAAPFVTLSVSHSASVPAAVSEEHITLPWRAHQRDGGPGRRAARALGSHVVARECSENQEHEQGQLLRTLGRRAQSPARSTEDHPIYHIRENSGHLCGWKDIAK
ncbi:hypothetical protein TREES_T100007872 [Tupaia chinensis]|uniref:Uncharacterized protein n=1 Tax=Tupaia chinensis TaxID=246437 RepID=L9JDN7_TUPCH|nr:hypothetical protein TREES_T100007872 [Tupaia chinensis]